jgi:hypothetical protein
MAHGATPKLSERTQKLKKEKKRNWDEKCTAAALECLIQAKKALRLLSAGLYF